MKESKGYALTSFGMYAETLGTLRASGGDYGGGSEIIVLESNQNHATAKDTEVCTTLPASMGMGGGYVPMILAYGFDARCKWVAEEKSQTVTATGGGGSYAYLIMTYQTVSGTVNAGAHPGSYNGQDAYNDMLVVNDGRTFGDGIPASQRRNHEGGMSYAEYNS